MYSWYCQDYLMVLISTKYKFYSSIKFYQQFLAYVPLTKQQTILKIFLTKKLRYEAAA